MKITAIAYNTFREAIRNKILYSVLLVTAAIVIISSIFGAVSIGDQVKVVKDFGLFCISFFGAIITIVAGVSLLNKELKQKLSTTSFPNQSLDGSSCSGSFLVSQQPLGC